MTIAAFMNVTGALDKAAALSETVKSVCVGSPHGALHVMPLDEFRKIEGSPFSYWVPRSARSLFGSELKCEGEDRIVRQGGVTGDDFRFLRAHWEVRYGDRLPFTWRPFAKGGAFSPYYRDLNLVVGWDDLRHTFWCYTGLKHRPSLKPSSADLYFRAGLTWPLRASRFAPMVLPRDSIFSIRGYAWLADEENLPALLALGNSTVFDGLFKSALGRADFPEFVVGVLQKLPLPQLSANEKGTLSGLGAQIVALKRKVDSTMQTSHGFWAPALLLVSGNTLRERARAWMACLRQTQVEVERLQSEVDQMAFQLYGLDAEDRDRLVQGLVAGAGSPEQDALQKEVAISGDEDGEPDLDIGQLTAALIDWVVGVIFGRFDVRCASSPQPPSALADLFAPLPIRAPGVLCQERDALRKREQERCVVEGPLVDDPGAERDIQTAVRKTLADVFEQRAEACWAECVDVLGQEGYGLRTWFARSFFEFHTKRYNRSSRRAPIYWQLATPSASYSLWLYYHHFTKDTFYNVLNEYVTPKVQHEERKLTSLVQTAGGSPTPSQRKEIAEQETFVEELRAFREEIARIAPLWNPDLNDGVIINFAPLWRLVPQHRAWQKECKDCWDRLVAGEYDWAHLAMHLWPERVVPKCAEDRSLAIAHGLEEVFWVETSNGKWQPRKVDKATVEKLIAQRTSPAVKDALQKLLSAPSPGTSRGSGRRQTSRGASPRSSRPAGADSRPDGNTARRGIAPDNSVLDAVKEAIAVAEGGATKAKVISTTGLTDSQWNAAINVLLAQGVVTKTGERRAARYHLVKTGGES